MALVALLRVAQPKKPKTVRSACCVYPATDRKGVLLFLVLLFVRLAGHEGSADGLFPLVTEIFSSNLVRCRDSAKNKTLDAHCKYP